MSFCPHAHESLHLTRRVQETMADSFRDYGGNHAQDDAPRTHSLGATLCMGHLVFEHAHCKKKCREAVDEKVNVEGARKTEPFNIVF